MLKLEHRKPPKSLSLVLFFNRKNGEVSQKPVNVVTGSYAVVGVCVPVADAAK